MSIFSCKANSVAVLIRIALDSSVFDSSVMFLSSCSISSDILYRNLAVPLLSSYISIFPYSSGSSSDSIASFSSSLVVGLACPFANSFSLSLSAGYSIRMLLTYAMMPLMNSFISGSWGVGEPVRIRRLFSLISSFIVSFLKYSEIFLVSPCVI